MLDEAFEEPRAAAMVMVGFERPWCIAGGWAIDLALGRATREHKDVEIAVFREDQHQLREYLADWSWRFVAEGEFAPWRADARLELPIHELHAKSSQGISLEFLLNERDAIDWIYRRDPSIRRPVEKAIRRGAEGMPILATEIVLLYKSKNPRPADELDFRVAAEILDPEACGWLMQALRTTGSADEWLKSLGG
jgi:hypothetical protein